MTYNVSVGRLTILSFSFNFWNIFGNQSVPFLIPLLATSRRRHSVFGLFMRESECVIVK